MSRAIPLLKPGIVPKATPGKDGLSVNAGVVQKATQEMNRDRRETARPADEANTGAGRGRDSIVQGGHL